MRNATIRNATLLALATALISGTANFMNKFAVTAAKDPVAFTTLKNAIVALLLIGLILAGKKWREIAALSKNQIIKLLAIGLVGGSVPFALFFTGLSQTTALNAGLIHKTLFVWVLLLAVPLLKERVTWPQWAGIGAIFASNLVIGGFTGFKYNAGEIMILAATILWAIENVIAKTVLKDLSPLTVASARMIIGSAALAVFVAWRGGGLAPFRLDAAAWSWTFLTSALLLGYVLTWYAALKRAPATYVAALLVPATLVTNVLSAVFITHKFSGLQAASALLLAAGTAMMIIFRKKPTNQTSSFSPTPKPLS